MLDNTIPYVAQQVEPRWEGFTNFSTWYVNITLNNDKRLYDQYRAILSQYPMFSDKQKAIEKFVRDRKMYFMHDKKIIELDRVNWEELTEDLCNNE